MFCTKCGSEIDDTTTVCPYCDQVVGAEVEGPVPADDVQRTEDITFTEPLQVDVPRYEEIPTVSPDATLQPAILDYPGESAAASPESDTKKIAIGILALVIVLLIVAAAILGKSFYDSQNSSATSSTAHMVSFNVTAPDYNAATDSKIPLHVVGSDSAGNHIDENRYITPEGRALELDRGTYRVTVAASPLLADGCLYEVPTDVFTVTVGDNDIGADASGALTSEAPSIVFEKVDPADVTDAMLSDAETCAKASGMDAAKIDSLLDGVEQARSDAQAQRKAGAQDGLAIATDDFEAQLPASWDGRVDVEYSPDGTVRVNAKGTSHMLLTFEVKQTPTANRGDRGSSYFASVPLGTGDFVWVSETSWPYIARVGSDIGTATLSELVDLSSGGQMSYDDALALPESDLLLSSVVIDYYATQIIPTVQPA